MEKFDLVGVGIGPSNLGLAALLDSNKEIKSLFLDSKPAFAWHDGASLPNALLQTTYLKDLVTMVDPTNKFSFLNYLAIKKQLYAFVNRRGNFLYRREYEMYLKWVAQSLTNLTFSTTVESIEFDGKEFLIKTNNKSYNSKNIVLGLGIEANIAQEIAGRKNILHSSTYAKNDKSEFREKRVAVIGGGQSGAEIIDDLFSGPEFPAEVHWISNRQNFFALQDCSFSNELYTPNYNRYFYKLPLDTRKNKNEALKYTSDGITESLSNSIYEKLYYLTFIEQGKCEFSIVPNSKLEKINDGPNGFKLHTLDKDTQEQVSINADIVILATGYKEKNTKLLKNLIPSIESPEELSLRQDYSVEWPYQHNRIFLQNGCKEHFGLADSNLSLSSWRNAVIANSLIGRTKYSLSSHSILYKDQHHEKTL